MHLVPCQLQITLALGSNGNWLVVCMGRFVVFGISNMSNALRSQLLFCALQ